MLVKVLGVDCDVIYVDHAYLPVEARQNHVHGALEGGRGVGETERHDQKFEESVSCDKGCLFLVFLLDRDLPISGGEVKFRTDLGFSEGVEDVVNSWERVNILLGLSIQLSVVDTKANGAVLLGNEMYGGCPGTCGKRDDVLLKHFVNLICGDFLFLLSLPSRVLSNGSIVQQRNRVLSWGRRGRTVDLELTRQNTFLFLCKS